MVPLLIVLAILALAGSGFAYNVLWIVAAVLLVLLLIGYIPRGDGTGRWYGRW